MRRTILWVALLAIVGCNQPAPEPEPKIDPADAQKRASDREKVLNQGNKN